MSIDKHTNYQYSGNYPIGADDRYWEQDRVADFRYLQGSIGRAIAEIYGTPPCILTGGIVTVGALVDGEYTLNISACTAVAKFSVEVLNLFSASPPSKAASDIDAILISMGAQTDFAIKTTATYGGTTNYVKLKYAEVNSESRDKAKSSGAYYFNVADSYTLTVTSAAPTAYEVCLGAFTVSTGAVPVWIEGSRTPSVKQVNSDNLYQWNERNAVINGNMLINQRAAATYTDASLASFYTLDRWEYIRDAGTTARVIITKDTTVPNTASQYSLKIASTADDATIAAGESAMIRTKIEGYNFFPFVGQASVLTFWVQSAVIGTYSVCLRNGTDRSYVVEYTISVANTWEKKQVNVTFNYSGGTWDYANGKGLEIDWVLMCGTTNTTSTLNTWNSDNKYASSNQVNFFATQPKTFYLTQVCLQVGTVPLRYPVVPFDVELLRCMRYYENGYPYGVAPGTVVGPGVVECFFGGTPNAGTAMYIPIDHKVEKRATPTSVSIYAPTTGAIGYVEGFVTGGAYNANWLVPSVTRYGTKRSIFGVSGATSSFMLFYMFAVDTEL